MKAKRKKPKCLQEFTMNLSSDKRKTPLCNGKNVGSVTTEESKRGEEGDHSVYF